MTSAITERPKPRTLWDVTPKGDMRLHFHEGQARTWLSERRFVFMLAGTQGGKALALDTEIPTPSGFVQMGDLRVGDRVLDEQGRPTRVSYISPIYLGNKCYRLTFDEGTSLIADAEHLWVTQNARQRKNVARRVAMPNRYWAARPQCQPAADSSIITTEQITDTMKGQGGRSNHSIPLVTASGSESELPIPAYTLGAWLGDGTSATAVLTTADTEVLDAIRADGIAVGEGKNGNAGKALCYRLGGTTIRGGSIAQRAATLQGKLRMLGVLNNKHIPMSYLTAGLQQRFALLQGLMDTDGSVGGDGRCEYSTESERLADDICTLLRGLGIKAYKGRGQHAWRLTFTTLLPVCRLSAKAKRLPKKVRPDTRQRFIVNCEPVPSVPVKCITVEAESGQYLCTRSYVPTHNTSFGPHWLYREIQRRGPGDYLAVAPTHPLMKLKMLPEFLGLFRDTLRLGTWHASDRAFEFHDKKTRVICGSAIHPESLESATAKGAWLDEVGQDDFKLDSWEAILRRLSLNMGRVLGTTTLYNVGWLKQQVYDPFLKGDPDVDVIQFNSLANPMFPEEEYKKAQGRLPDWKFRLFYQALFTRPAGMIYSDFVDEYREQGGHKVTPFPIPWQWPCYVGVDFGPVHTALIWVAEDNTRRPSNFYVYRESLEGGKTNRQHATAALTLARSENVVKWFGGAASEDDHRQEWLDAKVPVQRPHIGNIELQIDKVIELLKQHRLFFFDTCKGVLDDVATYGRKLDSNGEPTDEIRDEAKFHYGASLRYIVSEIGERVQSDGVVLGGRMRRR